ALRRVRCVATAPSPSAFGEATLLSLLGCLFIFYHESLTRGTPHGARREAAPDGLEVIWRILRPPSPHPAILRIASGHENPLSRDTKEWLNE
ncbi:MAG: hypothetical protein IJR99_05985, partial [Kiritimatiellae bacterium]|nr:hypothetical protein [Kiritimatiellia bacterium]